MHLQHTHDARIEATGRGLVTAQPDIALVRLGVITQAEDPKSAADENAKRMASVLAALKELMIPPTAIQTSGLSLQPVHEWDEDAKKSVLVGYRAENVVTVRTSVDIAGDVYDAGIQAGADEAGGITFTLLDDKKARRDAIILATKLALEEIQTVAKTLGVQLRGPLRAEVLSDGGPRPFEAALRKVDINTPIMPGTLDIIEQVHVVFEIVHEA